MTIDFQMNEFRTYEVRVEGLSLGFINTGTGAYTTAIGEKLKYDGDTVVLKDGRQFSGVTQLRTAINQNWLVVVGDAITQLRPKSAGIQVSATEHRGTGRVIKTTVELHQADERTVGSIADRKKSREAVNAEATRRVPLESQEARAALIQQETASTGDEEVDDLLSLIDEDMRKWSSQEEDEEVFDYRAEIGADISSLFDWVEQEATAPKKTKLTRPRVGSDPSAPKTKSARQLPVDFEDERITMPIVREATGNSGTVVGQVAGPKRMVLQREGEEITLDVARARPEMESPKPKPRFGGTGAIIVDEQRDMGRIMLSGNSAPIRLDESAKVSSGQTETIRMGDAQVGHRTAGFRPTTEVEGGVAVGRVLSPTKRSFIASDANTSTSAIQRASEGRSLHIEKFEDDGREVGLIKPRVVATGDVQEAIVGDTLEELLPEAVQGPKPEIHRRPESDPAYAAVKLLIPDFEWNKDRPVKEKVAAALKHIENPQYVKGILAVETELSKMEIKKALAAEIEKRAKAKKAKK